MCLSVVIISPVHLFLHLAVHSPTYEIDYFMSTIIKGTLAAIEGLLKHFASFGKKLII